MQTCRSRRCFSLRQCAGKCDLAPLSRRRVGRNSDQSKCQRNRRAEVLCQPRVSPRARRRGYGRHPPRCGYCGDSFRAPAWRQAHLVPPIVRYRQRLARSDQCVPRGGHRADRGRLSAHVLHSYRPGASVLSLAASMAASGAWVARRPSMLRAKRRERGSAPERSRDRAPIGDLGPAKVTDGVRPVSTSGPRRRRPTLGNRSALKDWFTWRGSGPDGFFGARPGHRVPNPRARAKWVPGPSSGH